MKNNFPSERCSVRYEYSLFRKLAEEYADEITRRTRQERAKNKRTKKTEELRQ